MKIKYFQDTDTLHIEFRAAEVAETKDSLRSRQERPNLRDHDRARKRTRRNTQVFLRTNYAISISTPSIAAIS